MEWMSVKPSSQAFTTVLQRFCFPLKHKGSHRDEREAAPRQSVWRKYGMEDVHGPTLFTKGAADSRNLIQDLIHPFIRDP